MLTETLQLAKKNLGTPDGVRELPGTKLAWVDLEDISLGRLTLEPGWRWSKDVRPFLKTESCQSSHVQYVISGRLRVVMDDGTRMDLEPGDCATIPPGHDAAVIGNEPFCAIDITGFVEMRRPGTISAYDAHELLRTDPAAILVCAYEKEEDFRRNDLEGAISLNEFHRRKDTFPKDENVIFYCACPHDETATNEARECFKEGFVNAKILQGGVEAWRHAGYGLVAARD